MGEENQRGARLSLEAVVVVALRPDTSNSTFGNLLIMSTSDPTGTQVTTDLSIASAPCDIDGVPRLLNELASLGRSHDLLTDRDGRLSLLDKARSLVAALETPRETVIRQCGAETASFYSIALGVDVGLFKELAKDGGSAKKAPTLAEALGFDVDVLRLSLILSPPRQTVR